MVSKMCEPLRFYYTWPRIMCAHIHGKYDIQNVSGIPIQKDLVCVSVGASIKLPVPLGIRPSSGTNLSLPNNSIYLGIIHDVLCRCLICDFRRDRVLHLERFLDCSNFVVVRPCQLKKQLT